MLQRIPTIRILHRGLSAVAIALMCLFAGSAEAAGSAASEYAVKAAIVYKLTKFVTWPDATFSGPQDRLTICLDANSAYLPAMQALDGRTAQGRVVEIHALQGGEPVAATCNVLFVSDAENTLLADVLRSASTAPVLTIGEGDSFVERGGIIGLRVEQNRIAFVVSVDASQRAGLGISASLLQLATIVRPGGV